jgi:hypothetical protein
LERLRGLADELDAQLTELKDERDAIVADAEDTAKRDALDSQIAEYTGLLSSWQSDTTDLIEIVDEWVRAIFGDTSVSGMLLNYIATNPLLVSSIVSAGAAGYTDVSLSKILVAYFPDIVSELTSIVALTDSIISFGQSLAVEISGSSISMVPTEAGTDLIGPESSKSLSGSSLSQAYLEFMFYGTEPSSSDPAVTAARSALGEAFSVPNLQQAVGQIIVGGSKTDGGLPVNCTVGALDVLNQLQIYIGLVTSLLSEWFAIQKEIVEDPSGANNDLLAVPGIDDDEYEAFLDDANEQLKGRYLRSLRS